MKAHWLWGAIGLAGFVTAAHAHPLDGLTRDDYEKVNAIMRGAGEAGDTTLFPLIELIEPPKAAVLAWTEGVQLDRRARVDYTAAAGFKEAIVNITQGKVERTAPASGQPMVLYEEFSAALKGVLENKDMVAGLAKRGLKPEQAFCLPLTAGNFLTTAYKGSRLMKVPCYQVPDGSNHYAKPIEGLFALYDIGKRQVLGVTDTGVVAVPTDGWGYTEKEVAARAPLRPLSSPVLMSQPGGPNFKIDGSHVTWDIWRFNLRVDKRPGLVLSNLDVNDDGTWRSVIYQTHLSEVFVPYSDPDKGWYWRTYMDSGEYGFGQFMSPLRAGIDCPDYATFKPALIADDAGKPQEIPNAICLFERNVGDAAWRHYEIFEQSPGKAVPAEGRPETELVVRTASEVGNYDYYIDYRLKQNGQIFIMVGATGIDAVKGVASRSRHDPTAAKDTQYGTLVAPNLVAANHDHYFNFRIDFDIDQPANNFHTMDIVPAKAPAGSPRRSLWKVEMTAPRTELEARYQMSTAKPRFFEISSAGGHDHDGGHSGWMIHHANVAISPYDYKNDPPMKRNAYISNHIWVTVYDPEQQYAGGKYPMQSDGHDTLAEWVKKNRPLPGKDLVVWVTAGFQHVPRTEDWPVMSTDWKTIHIMPHNFFKRNPALTLRTDPAK